DPTQVIVFQDGDRSVGVVVDEILDIVEETVSARQTCSRAGLLGSAVVGKRVADFVDLQVIMSSAFSDWGGGRTSCRSTTILLAEPSAFVRGLLRGELEMAGYRVV